MGQEGQCGLYVSGLLRKVGQTRSRQVNAKKGSGTGRCTSVVPGFGHCSVLYLLWLKSLQYCAQGPWENLFGLPFHKVP